ncbi:MAG: alpha/beta hydrolase [Acidaminococcaceae bacterium]
MAVSGYLQTSDQATIYYEVAGEGQPVVLVHGWSCSSKFYARNVAGLQAQFQVITLDLRGHGKSSKGLQGYTLERLAQDVRELLVYLDLHEVLLMGWSLGGPLLLAYWRQFKQDSRLAGLGLIDMTPFPMGAAPWNSHGLREHNAEAFNGMVSALLANQQGFVDGFVKKMFPEGVQEANTQWINAECMKLPPYIGIALYSAYAYGDFTDVLPTITVPTLVLAANSQIFPASIEQGRQIAAQIPQGQFVPFQTGGHLFFYLVAEKFNQAVLTFAKSL